MSQPNQKVHKQKRLRTNSQSNTPQTQKSDLGGNQGGGGGGRKNKNNYHHSNNSPFSGTKVYSNSNRAAELQSLLNNLPQQNSGQNSSLNGGGSGKRRQSQSGLGDGGPTPVSLVSTMNATTLVHKKGYAGAVISGAINSTNSGNQQNSGEIAGNDEESNRLNATALRRIDSAFLKLHGTASQVAVYRYNPSTQSWDKTDTVGCLFLYERNVSPKYGLVVMNRKNANNFIQCFGPDGQVVLHQPYLLLRAVEDINTDPSDGTQVIHCIWFYDAQDCIASANILRKMGLQFEGEALVAGGAQQMQSSIALQNPTAAQRQLSGNALFQILQKKKETPSSTSTSKVMTAEELESQMLHELNHSSSKENVNVFAPFTKGIGNGVPTAPLNVLNCPSLDSRTPSAPSSKLNLNSGGDSSIFQQFLNMSMNDKQAESKVRSQASPVTVKQADVSVSMNHAFGSQNKMRTVEQLERDMKKERSSDSSSSASTAAIQNELMQTLGIPNLGGDNQDPLVDTTSSCLKPTEMSVLQNIVGKSVDETDPEDLRRALQTIDPTDHLILVTEQTPGQESRLTWKINRSSSLRKENDSTFTTPTGEFLSASGTRCSSQLGLTSEVKYFENTVRPVDIKPTPLTKEQLHQALAYLLQNDSDFITKIHDAYVKSLQQAYDVRQF